MNENALYEAKLVEVEDNLDELKDINIETKELEKQVAKIKEDTEKKIKKCYEDNLNSVFCNDLIKKIYYEATKSLDKINNIIIRKYEEFYTIINTYNELKDIDITIENIERIKNSTITLLRRILQTTETIENYNEILNKIYKFAYKVVKYELLFKKTSEVLNFLKENIACISPIAKMVKEDIQDLSKKEQKELEEKLGNISKNGFDDIYYLDNNLISFLTNNNTENNSKKFLKELEKSINDTYSNYEKLKIQKENSEKNISFKIKEIKDSKKIKNAIWRKRTSQKALFALNILGVLGASIVAYNLVGKIPDTKRYKTIYTVYDTSNPDVLDEKVSYDKEQANKLEIIEYSPWEAPGYFRDEYRRNVYKYVLTNNIPYSENVEDYLNAGFKEYINTDSTSISTEKNEENPMENYKENKYIITQTYQDRTDFKYVENKLAKILTLIASIIGIGVIDIIIILIYRDYKTDTKKDLLEAKKVLKDEKRLLLEEKNSLNSLKNDLEIAKKRFLEQYEELPKSLQEDKKILKKVHKIEDNKDCYYI